MFQVRETTGKRGRREKRLEKLQDKPSPGSEGTRGCPRALLSRSGPPRLLAGVNSRGVLLPKPSAPVTAEQEDAREAAAASSGPGLGFLRGRKLRPPVLCTVHSPALKETRGLHP